MLTEPHETPFLGTFFNKRSCSYHLCNEYLLKEALPLAFI